MSGLAFWSLISLAEVVLAWNFVEFKGDVEWTVLARSLDYPTHIQSLFEVPGHDTCPMIKIRGLSGSKVIVDSFVSRSRKFSSATLLRSDPNLLVTAGFINPNPPECHGSSLEHRIPFTDYTNLTVFSTSILSSTAKNGTLNVAHGTYFWVLGNVRENKNISSWRDLIEKRVPSVSLRKLRFRTSLESSCSLTEEEVWSLKYCVERSVKEVQRSAITKHSLKQMEAVYARLPFTMPNETYVKAPFEEDEKTSDVLILAVLGVIGVVAIVVVFFAQRYFTQ